MKNFKPACTVPEADARQGADGAQQRSVLNVLDAASTGATQPGAASVECAGRFVWLLVDLSNSNAKFALATREHLLKKKSLPTASLSEEILEEATRGWAPEHAVIASVVPPAAKALAAFLKKKNIPFLFIDAHMDLGIEMSYPKSTPIGADCLANIVAAKKLYPFPSIVIDLGTAITFDAIDPHGIYLGIVIAPGLMTSAKALHEHTALLPQITPTGIKNVIGKNTIDAMHSGLILGTQGLIREVIARISKENFPLHKPTIIATGGDAELIGKGNNLFDIINPNLTLEGLREIACRILSRGTRDYTHHE